MMGRTCRAVIFLALDSTAGGNRPSVESRPGFKSLERVLTAKHDPLRRKALRTRMQLIIR
jgi:hypothetical protein